jgi:hypothetical protein
MDFSWSEKKTEAGIHVSMLGIHGKVEAIAEQCPNQDFESCD